MLRKAINMVLITIVLSVSLMSILTSNVMASHLGSCGIRFGSGIIGIRGRVCENRQMRIDNRQMRRDSYGYYYESKSYGSHLLIRPFGIFRGSCGIFGCN